MEYPVTIRFRWTAEEVLQANRYHFRHTCRPGFRFGLHFLFAAIFATGVLMLTTSGPAGKAPLPVSIGCLVVGVYWFTIRPFERRWWTRRQFSKRPDKDTEVEWCVAPDKLAAVSAVGRGEYNWNAFTKAMRTPKGLMLYPIDQMYHWLPRHGFASDTEYERVVELAKSKIQRFYDVV